MPVSRLTPKQYPDAPFSTSQATESLLLAVLVVGAAAMKADQPPRPNAPKRPQVSSESPVCCGGLDVPKKRTEEAFCVDPGFWDTPTVAKELPLVVVAIAGGGMNDPGVLPFAMLTPPPAAAAFLNALHSASPWVVFLWYEDDVDASLLLFFLSGFAASCLGCSGRVRLHLLFGRSRWQYSILL